LVLAKAAVGVVISKQDTFINQFAPNSLQTTKIDCAVFSSSDSSKIAFTTSEGSLQGMFGGHLAVIDMVNKCLDRVYVEPFHCSGGVSFNTNDSILATGNSNGDVTLRNLYHSEGGGQ